VTQSLDHAVKPPGVDPAARLSSRSLLGRLLQVIGVVGTASCIVVFAVHPSFLMPDKVFVFLLFLFMALRHAKALVFRLAPFVAILFVYELFRGFAPQLNHRVEYTWMVRADEALFGSLPTTQLQELWWHGSTRWLDVFFYSFYVSHFVLPIACALVIWRWRERIYWEYVTSIAVVSFAGFLTFVAFPAAPPWMASDRGLIEPITRISGHVWMVLGVEDFPTIYNEITPNQVAAVPSLHAAYATIVALYVFRLFGVGWGVLSSVYPFAVYVGTVYLGEHYAIDEVIGAAYGLGAFLIAKWLFDRGYAGRAAARARAWLDLGPAELNESYVAGRRTTVTRSSR
jgi:hypothetical protein